MKKFREGKVWK